MNLFENETPQEAREWQELWYEVALRATVALEQLAENTKPAKKQQQSPKAAGEFEKIVSAVRTEWDTIAEANKLPECRVFNRTMEANLRARLADEKKFHKCDDEGALAEVLKTMKMIPTQDFACGRTAGATSNKTWKIKLSDFLQATKYEKVKHNGYSDTRQQGTNGRVRSRSFLAGTGKKTTAEVGTKGSLLGEDT